MAPKEEVKNPLDHIRPSLINLESIYGVNLEDGTYDPHPDFPNPKINLRQDVLDSLWTCKSPSEVPAIEVFLHTDGSIVCLDGAHRIINAVKKVGDAKDSFKKIKVNRYIPDSSSKNAVLDAQIRSQTHNLEFLRGDLTEGEEVGVVQHLLALGLEPKEIITKVGKGNTRWVTKIERIVNATPDVLEAVKRGDLSLETGARIAKTTAVSEQSQKVVEAIESEKKQGGTKTRVDLGMERERIKVASTSAMLGRLWSIFEEVEKDFGTPSMDPTTEGEWNILMFYFGFEKADHEETMGKLRPQYDEYVDKQNNPKPRGRPRKDK